MKRILLLLAALIAVWFVVLAVRPDPPRTFTLTLSPASVTNLASLFYKDQGDPAEGQRLCEFYRTQTVPNLEQMFCPISFAPDGRFTVDVPAFGAGRPKSFLRNSEPADCILLMGRLNSGARVFQCVALPATVPVELK